MKNKLYKIFSMVVLTTLSLNIGTYKTASDENIHNIENGDSLWDISDKYNSDLDTIIDLNPQILNPDMIYPDEKVNLPMIDKNSENDNESHAQQENSDGNSQSIYISEKKIQKKIADDIEKSSQIKAKENLYRQDLLDLVNEQRTQSGLGQLVLNSQLSDLAQIKSEDMRNYDYFQHASFRLGTPFAMLKRDGIEYKTAGENLGRGQKTPAAVLESWMKSETHRENILNPGFKEIGIGYATDGHGLSYWTQLFVSM